MRELSVAEQRYMDEWVAYYNTARPHQSLGDGTPESRFRLTGAPTRGPRPAPERTGEQWVTRRVAANGLASVGWQQVSVGKHYGEAPATFSSAMASCSSGLATNSSRPWLAPGVVNPQEERLRDRRKSPLKAWESVKDQPKVVRQESTEAPRPR
jgi:hypothetical protein